MICEQCANEYAEVDGLCAVCHAEETFDFSVVIVESDRPRHIEHARLDTKHTEKEARGQVDRHDFLFSSKSCST